MQAPCADLPLCKVCYTVFAAAGACCTLTVYHRQQIVADQQYVASCVVGLCQKTWPTGLKPFKFLLVILASQNSLKEYVLRLCPCCYWHLPNAEHEHTQNMSIVVHAESRSWVTL